MIKKLCEMLHYKYCLQLIVNKRKKTTNRKKKKT